jgi:hypothetical protein
VLASVTFPFSGGSHCAMRPSAGVRWNELYILHTLHTRKPADAIRTCGNYVRKALVNTLKLLAPGWRVDSKILGNLSNTV